MSLRVLFIGNPTAQSGKAAARIDAAARAMRARGWETTVLSTEPEGRTVPVVAAALDAQPFDVVVFLGGDGTFSEVGAGVLDARQKIPLGMLPAGTANDQGRSFGIPSAPERLQWNLDVIEGGHLTWLDVARVQRVGKDGQVDAEQRVFHSVGWGMQSDILVQRNVDRASVRTIPLLRELYRDQAVYVGATLKRLVASWVEPTKFDADLIINGEQRFFEGLTDLLFNGTPVLGGLWVFDREARADDGHFEGVPIHGRREMASKALLSLEKSPIWVEHTDLLGLSHSGVFPVSSAEVVLHRPGREAIQTQVDGEEWVAGDHFRFVVTQGALPVITPAEFVGAWERRAD